MTPEPCRVKPPRVARTHRDHIGVAELLGAALGNQVRQVVQLAKIVPPIAGVALAGARGSMRAVPARPR